ncbi:MAG: M20/M25/M40 family metallo-hydrolase, partial [Lachnospiraceae bacterium]|nr:M20/M25/M40 family metallo-hydrolase [Lachnospiraceae bacterium]
MVLDYFKEVSSIPRGSGFNTKISNYLVEFAKKHELEYIQDEAENVVIYKPASKGYENCPPLIMQGHMDMVCEKVSEDAHDFENEGIRLITRDNYITADGTTLGADDGIALAYMLEFLADDSLVCPPLEMVFTTDEEIGMTGAIHFDAAALRGKHMINLDSEDENGFIAACAGGATAKTDISVNTETREGIELGIEVSGLKGGHSGVDIDKNRANAVLLIGRMLAYLPDKYFGLIDIGGGNKFLLYTSSAADE